MTHNLPLQLQKQRATSSSSDAVGHLHFRAGAWCPKSRNRRGIRESLLPSSSRLDFGVFSLLRIRPTRRVAGHLS